MQVPRSIINKWGKVREHGDVQAIAKLTGLNEASVSRILSGKQATRPEAIILIKAYLSKREKQRAALGVDQD